MKSPFGFIPHFDDAQAAAVAAGEWSGKPAADGETGQQFGPACQVEWEARSAAGQAKGAIASAMTWSFNADPGRARILAASTSGAADCQWSVVESKPSRSLSSVASAIFPPTTSRAVSVTT